MSRRIAVATSLLTVSAAACSFGAYDAIVPYGKLNVADTAALAVSADASTAFAVDQQATVGTWSESLKSFDASSGNLLGELTVTGTWTVAALAPATNAATPGSVWTLHANGYRIRFDPSLSGSSFEQPIPLTGATTASARTYCDMDRSDGIFFITTVDHSSAGAVAYLYRQPREGAWERIELTQLAGKCGRVATDETVSEVVVLDPYLDEVWVYDDESLSHLETIDVSGHGDFVTDIVATAGHTHVAVKVSNTEDLLVSFDDTGTLNDSTVVGELKAIAPHVDTATHSATLFWSGMDTWPVKYTVGSFELGQ